MNLEYIFYQNKYNQPVFATRKKGTIKYNFGYPFSVDGLKELERGETEGGKKIVRFFKELCEKHNLTN